MTCPKCGESTERDAKFCKECATKLSAESPTAKSEATAGDAKTEESDDE